jgi:hypothetical protein
MLPQVHGLLLRVMAGTLLAVGVWLGGCASEAKPDAQVRAVIAAGEVAAEDRDVAGILEHVSPAFRDEQGQGPDELEQYLRGYFVMHQSVRLLTRIESVEFPYRDYARVRLKLGTFGREASDTASLEFAADVHDVALELKLEDQAWKVVRAEWNSARRG